MSGNFYLDWAIMVVSLFNTTLLIWLGLTVLLNSDRQTWGIWLAGGGLLLGGAFFISHTAILGHGLTYVSWGMNFWWRTGWTPVIALPIVWYLIVLWYAGFWDDRQSPLHRRQWPWLLGSIGLAVALVGLLLFANPLPSYAQVVQLKLSATPAIGGIPLLILVYPLYIILCITLSLDALRRPTPSARVMGDLARQRARPWLVTTSLVLLLVSLLVAWAMFWVVFNARQRTFYGVYNHMTLTVAWFDLTIATLIALAILLQGQAIVAYELFTGRTLPHRGLQRQWHRAVILAAGYGLVIGWSLVAQLRPIYGLLLSTILIALFYALLSWRAYAERERYIAHLRPFVTSQRLYEQLLTGSGRPSARPDEVTPFEALCRDILETTQAYLVPLGPIAPLAGPAMIYPTGKQSSLPPLTSLVAKFPSPAINCLPLDPAQYTGAIWAVPLWSERGLIGIFLLGAKRGGGLYTQEEIEIAQASGERLIDAHASTEMARRLMSLQRQRLAQTQVMDRQTRRVLHDDILPQLHAAMLGLNSGGQTTHLQRSSSFAEALALLSDVHSKISQLLCAAPGAPHTSSPRSSPLELISALKRILTNELPNAFDEVHWQIEPEAADVLETLSPLTTEVIFYAAREAIRNTAHHGRGQNPARPLQMQIKILPQDGLTIQIEDDGVGFDFGGESPGRNGQGLALHSTMMAVVGGHLSVEGVRDSYTRVSLTIPQVMWP